MEQVNQFKRAWINQAFVYTKEYESIYAAQLVALLQELPPPLGVGPHGSYYDCQMLAKKVGFDTSTSSHRNKMDLESCSLGFFFGNRRIFVCLDSMYSAVACTVFVNQNKMVL